MHDQENQAKQTAIAAAAREHALVEAALARRAAEERERNWAIEHEHLPIHRREGFFAFAAIFSLSLSFSFSFSFLIFDVSNLSVSILPRIVRPCNCGASALISSSSGFSSGAISGGVSSLTGSATSTSSGSSDFGLGSEDFGERSILPTTFTLSFSLSGDSSFLIVFSTGVATGACQRDRGHQRRDGRIRTRHRNSGSDNRL